MAVLEIKKINDCISYIPACTEPLSADVGIIYGKNRTYLYDVGSTIENLEFMYSLKEPFSIITSHFHGDHIWWLEKHRAGDAGVKPGDTLSLDYKRPRYAELYVSSQTKKYTEDGIVVSERMTINDTAADGTPLTLEIIPFPSSHAKGCLALMVNDEILFTGDGTYCVWKSAGAGEDEENAPGVGFAQYNVQQLKAEIDLLSELKAEKIALSHDRKFIRPKKVILRELQSAYAQREPGQNIIIVK